MRTRRRLVGLVLGLGIAATCAAAPPDPALEAVTFNIAFCSTSAPQLNPNDQSASLKAFAMTVGRRKGYRMEVTALNFTDPAGLASGLERTNIHLAILDVVDYLGLTNASRLEPAFTPVEEGALAEPYLLLSKRGSPFENVASLRGTDIVLLNSLNANSGRFWLDVLLGEAGFGSPTSFFKGITTVVKPSSAVLPIFFGTKTACVVDQSGFDIMKELNPQVGHSLRVVATSVPLVDSMICFGRDGWEKPKHRADLQQFLEELHLEPAGQQILNMFRTTRLAPFHEDHLRAMRDLWARHRRLGKPASDSPNPTPTAEPRSPTPRAPSPSGTPPRDSSPR